MQGAAHAYRSSDDVDVEPEDVAPALLGVVVAVEPDRRHVVPERRVAVLLEDPLARLQLVPQVLGLLVWTVDDALAASDAFPLNYQSRDDEVGAILVDPFRRVVAERVDVGHDAYLVHGHGELLRCG